MLNNITKKPNSTQIIMGCVWYQTHMPQDSLNLVATGSSLSLML